MVTCGFLSSLLSALPGDEWCTSAARQVRGVRMVGGEKKRGARDCPELGSASSVSRK